MSERRRDPDTYEAFWPEYVRAHTKPATRALHALGTALSFVALAAFGVTRRPRYLLAVPLLGYGPAWLSHFFIEGNKPATFRHPFWSLRGDFEMMVRMLTGTMAAEVERCTRAEEEPMVTIQGEASAPEYAHAAPDATVH
jgi:hypothetical protein